MQTPVFISYFLGEEEQKEWIFSRVLVSRESHPTICEIILSGAEKIFTIFACFQHVFEKCKCMLQFGFILYKFKLQLQMLYSYDKSGRKQQTDI